MNFYFSILTAILTWPLVILLQIPAYLLGWILVPIATALKAYTVTQRLGQLDGNGEPRIDYHFTWRFMFLWDNWEDGICAGRQYLNLPGVFLQTVYWSCMRNPINNMRITPYISCKIEPIKVQFKGSQNSALKYDLRPATPEWYYAWCGPYSNVWWQFKMGGSIWRLWIGHKIMPKDSLGLVSEYRKKGAGFAFQFKKVG